MKFKATRRQNAFIHAQQFEVLFGGAAGGGKSYGQMLDAVYFAYRFPGSSQLILRKTMPELEATLIQTLRAYYPYYWYNYHMTAHRCKFKNGSLIQFGYCRTDGDVYRYQSAEYDVIRFDELTHFTEHMYTYLLSRIRGANRFPKQVKSATNPGGIGHTWVKQRFIDVGAPDTEYATPAGSRIFLPAHVDDNVFLTKRDPGYKCRLENLSDTDKRALLYGEWNINDGCYFDEWNTALHIVRPFEIPLHWRRYFTMDYGLDMLAGYWIAVDDNGKGYVYRELYESGHIISSAAQRILQFTTEPVHDYIAPPDLWNRRQDTGRSAAELFLEYGIMLTKAPASRVGGWLELKEWLKPVMSPTGRGSEARLVFFDHCTNAIRSIPSLMRDKKNPSDCAVHPHTYTHAPDAIRYFVASRLAEEKKQGISENEEPDQLQTLLNYR